MSETNSTKVLVKYEVLCGFVLKTVVDSVNSLIAQGWQPIGGVSINSNGEYLQAVVLYDWY